MKTVILTEFLVEKDYISTHLEEVLSLYPDSIIMSLCYKPMSQGARIESHTIVSSQAPYEKLKKNPGIVRAMVQNLIIPEDTELVISLSRGYIHFIKKPEHTKHLSYIMDYPEKKSLLSQVLAIGKKPQIDKALFLSKYIAKKNDHFDQGNREILNPFFKLGSHEADGIGQTSREIDCVIHLSKKSRVNVNKLAKELEGINFLFHAENSLLDEMLGDGELRQNHSYQQGCHGTEQKLFENTKLFVDMTNLSFNPHCFKAMSAGVAVYIPQDVYGELIPNEFSMRYLNNVDIKEALECSWWEQFDPSKARRQALRLNGRIFKRSLKKQVELLINK